LLFELQISANSLAQITYGKAACVKLAFYIQRMQWLGHLGLTGANCSVSLKRATLSPTTTFAATFSFFHIASPPLNTVDIIQVQEPLNAHLLFTKPEEGLIVAAFRYIESTLDYSSHF
jgi:hypothetical protein